MPRFSVPVPADFRLWRDCCSYGYFLLAPNTWDVDTQTLTRGLRVASGPVSVSVSQEHGAGEPLRVTTDRAVAAAERADISRQLTRMLRLDEPRDLMREFHKADPRWKRVGRGRLFRSPTMFEDVIKTVTSCNVTWPSTVVMNRRLCEVLGEAVGDTHTFPTPAKIARTRPATLRARCRVGYRDARIVELARLFMLPRSRGGVEPVWFEHPATPDDAVHDALLELPGIGPYAAANIMQLLGRYTRLPLDTESVRHGRTVLGMKGETKAMMKRMHEHYRPFGVHAFRSYWFELWEFYERKHGPAHTWERDSTGKMFTAALLSK